MKNVTAIILLMCWENTLYSQSIPAVDKIIITYEKGHSDWGNPGVYSEMEKIELLKVKDNINHFLINQFIQIRKYVESRDMIYKSDTVFVSTSTGIRIKSSEVNDFLINLNQSKDNFNLLFIIPYLNKPTRKEVIASLTNQGIKDKLFSDYVSKKSRKVLLKKIMNFYLLDSFLHSQKYKLKLPLFTTDSWNYVSIDIIHSNDTARYWSQLSQPLSQPFTKMNKDSIDINVVNLEINLRLRNILPLESKLRTQLSFNSLKEDYIKWFLKNKR